MQKPGKSLVDAEFLRDPYPVYQALRSSNPVYWSDEFCGGAWLLTRYEDVALALQDSRFSVQRTAGWIEASGPEARNELREFRRIFSRAMLFLNAPRHTRLRQVINAGFKPLAITALAPRIAAIADELIDSIEARSLTPTPLPGGEGLDRRGAVFFDFIEDFARPLPSRVIAKMLGVDENDCGRFGMWADDVADFIGSPTPTREVARRAQAGLVAMTEYFGALLPERRANPGDDLVSLLLRAEAEGRIGTTAELLAQCAMLLVGGVETTRNLLGNGLLALLRHPDQLRALRAQPELLPSALRELLRYDSPVQYTGRRLVADVTLHGRTMKKGDLVIALIGAANRDPARFTDPETLDLRRNEGNHLSFGFGPHVCIGAALTMLEGRIAFERLLTRLPHSALADGQIEWSGNSVYRGLARLPLRLSPPMRESTAIDSAQKAMPCPA